MWIQTHHASLMSPGFLFASPETPQIQEDGFDEERLLLELGAICPGAPVLEVPFEALVDDELDFYLPEPAALSGRTWIYRGWMPTLEEYQRLEVWFAERDASLLVSSEEFERAHYLPEALEANPALRRFCPETKYTEEADRDLAFELAGTFSGEIFLKDHVKSAKPEMATYDARTRSRTLFDQACDVLEAARGERFERGYVLRAYADLLAPDGDVDLSGDGVDEARVFVVGGKAVAAYAYRSRPGIGEGLLASRFETWREELRELLSLDSPFFTLDIAQKPNGELVVLDVGDGGVSTIPAGSDPRPVLNALYAAAEFRG